ncbi:HU family DNA-binding protein [Pseudoalteromonas umbrosa]|uniref:HU family DNA-binding protein n=1 Tax=Pseudoalteromonas umbrosa TaxID=3048489 RepID=UPI0024C27645|nr:HU family DNA-binding protein [Pseudoalteromonas sp. B95]MDK1290120.1 HU family DNA-binding protein [Pseudoalteromonas sp. B95]
MAASKKDLAEMIKADFAADNINISTAKCSDMVNTVLGAVCNALVSGEDVRVQNFGTLKLTRRNARIGRNPSTGEAVPIDPHLTVAFTPAEGLKEEINEKNNVADFK